MSLFNLKLYSLADDELSSRVSFDVENFSKDALDDDIVEEIVASKPDLLGFSCFLWSTDRLVRIGAAVKKRIENLRIVLGGPDASPRAEMLLKRHPHITAVAVGEGEESFRLLLRRIVGVDEDNLPSTLGWAFRCDDSIIINPRPKPVDMDRIPVVITDNGYLNRYGDVLFMESSRGCKFRCAYCGFHTFSKNRRGRSVESVNAAVTLADSNGVRFLSFLDPGFNQNKEMFRGVMQHIDRYPGLSLNGLEINVEDMEEEDIELLARNTSGLLGIGLQSTNPNALSAVGRRYCEERYRSRIEMMRKHNLGFNLDIIYGLPEDDYSTLKKTFDDALSMRPHMALLFQLMVLPGTYLAAEAKKWRMKYLDEPPYLMESNKNFSKADMEAAKRLADTNFIFVTQSADSFAMQLAARELNKLPSEILEIFLSGEWCDKTISSGMLKDWKNCKNIEECIEVVRDFFSYLFKTAGAAEMPTAIRDLFELQFNMGRVNVSAPSVATQSAARPLPNGIKLRMANAVRVFPVETDVLKLVSDWTTLDEARVPRFFMLVQRTPKMLKRMRVSDLVAYILSLANGKRDLEEIIRCAISKSGAEPSEDVEKQISKAIEDIVDRGIIIVESP